MRPQNACISLAAYLDLGVDEDDQQALVRLQKALTGLEQVLPGRPISLAELERRGRVVAEADGIQKKIRWQGLQIDIENPRGTVRQGVDPGGHPWSVQMLNDYGYIRKTLGEDGDDVDCYCGPNMDTATHVYVVHQRKPPSFATYDEDKCMLGFTDESSAQRAYLAQYDRPEFLGPIEAFTVKAFVDHVKKHKKAPGTMPDNYLTPVQLMQRLLQMGM